MKALALVLGIALAVSQAAPGQGAASDLFTVETSDSLGNGWKADRVTWYVVVGGAAVEHEAVCSNAQCTSWRWDSPPSGEFHVQATWTEPVPQDPNCLWSAYDASPVQRAPAQQLTVRLKLNALPACE